MNLQSRNRKKLILNLKHLFYIFLFLTFTICVIFANFYFKVKNININFFDDKAENQEIKTFTENLLRQNSSSLLSYTKLDEDQITKKVHDEFQIVSNVKISKNYKMDLNVVVTKNDEFFYTCVDDSLGFLAKCMLGNVDGVYYKEIEVGDDEKLSIEINPKVLYDAVTLEKIEDPDSLSGARIYTKEDFKVLKEIINWTLKNGFQIKKVYVDQLKIVSIYTDDYMIKISLDKGYVDTVKDFEIISRTGNLQKFINEDKENLNYIDLSYKNKVFYKLKDVGATTTKASTSTTTVIH